MMMTTTTTVHAVRAAAATTETITIHVAQTFSSCGSTYISTCCGAFVIQSNRVPYHTIATTSHKAYTRTECFPQNNRASGRARARVPFAQNLLRIWKCTLSSRLNANACSHLFQHIEARNIQFLLPDSEFGVYKVKLVSVAFAPMPVVAAAAAHTKTNPNS